MQFYFVTFFFILTSLIVGSQSVALESRASGPLNTISSVCARRSLQVSGVGSIQSATPILSGSCNEESKRNLRTSSLNINKCLGVDGDGRLTCQKNGNFLKKCQGCSVENQFDDSTGPNIRCERCKEGGPRTGRYITTCVGVKNKRIVCTDAKGFPV